MSTSADRAGTSSGGSSRRRLAAVGAGVAVLVVVLAAAGIWVAVGDGGGPGEAEERAYLEQVQREWSAGAAAVRALPGQAGGPAGPLDVGWTEESLVEAGMLVCGEGVGQWGLVARYPDRMGAGSAAMVETAALQHLC